MSDLPAVYDVLADRFDDEVDAAPDLTLEDVRHFVAGHVARLLDENPGLLMSILYRIDVSEEKVRAVLEHERTVVIPGRLAELIIARQLEKIETHRRY